MPVRQCPSVQGTYSRGDAYSYEQRNTPTLIIHVLFRVGGETYNLKALIDTGAEVCVIRKGILADHCLERSQVPIMLSGADATSFKGGKYGSQGMLTMKAKELDHERPIQLQCPIHFYEAQIAAEAIIGYDWLARHNFIVVPRGHHLEFRDENTCLVIMGMSQRKGKKRVQPEIKPVSQARVVQPHEEPEPTEHLSIHTEPSREKEEPIITSVESNPDSQEEFVMVEVPTGSPRQIQEVATSSTSVQRPRMLDLFSGTNSVGDIFRARGYEVVSVDNHASFNPTICIDIMQWDFERAYPIGYFEVIAASPPCTEYSSAMTMRPRQLDMADTLVLQGLDIIRHFNPRFWFLENPRLGLLKSRKFMQDLPYVDVDYCQFSDWGYMKPTRIWGSPVLGQIRPRYCDRRTCKNMITRSSGHTGHKFILGATPYDGADRISKEQQYRIPEGVITYLMGWERHESDWMDYRKPTTPDEAITSEMANLNISAIDPGMLPELVAHL